MSTECIHGLDLALCDVCSPAKVPEPAPRSARTPKATPGRRSTPVGEPSATRSTTRSSALREKAAPPVDIAAQRIYHVTHIDNLPAIVAAGAVLADTALETRPEVDLSAAPTREHRRSIDATAGNPVASFVPFFLSPHAALWADLRGERIAPHWSSQAQAAVASQFVILVGSLSCATVLTDGDASHVLTRFAGNPDAFTRSVAHLLADEPALLSAEALVPERFPLEQVAVIGVANMTVRNKVRALFDGVEASPRVAMYPPWFQPVADAD